MMHPLRARRRPGDHIETAGVLAQHGVRDQLGTSVPRAAQSAKRVLAASRCSPPCLGCPEHRDPFVRSVRARALHAGHRRRFLGAVRRRLLGRVLPQPRATRAQVRLHGQRSAGLLSGGHRGPVDAGVLGLHVALQQRGRVLAGWRRVGSARPGDTAAPAGAWSKGRGRQGSRLHESACRPAPGGRAHRLHSTRESHEARSNILRGSNTRPPTNRRRLALSSGQCLSGVASLCCACATRPRSNSASALSQSSNSWPPTRPRAS